MKGPDCILALRDCEVYAFPLQHRIDCFGFRICWLKTGQSAAYCSDTAVFPEEAEWLQGTDLIYHEATFADEHVDLAHKMFHSTAREAAAVAAAAGAKKLVLGHFSSRYLDLGVLLSQAREVFPESYLAEEGKIFEV